MASHSKGDFQLSLGFIISVVFAIVLLSVAIVWLRGTIGNISGLTDDLTQQAQQALSDTFRSTTTTFSVFPTSYKLAPGKTLIMQGGIKNDAGDGQTHLFVVNIKPEGVSRNICPDGTLTCTPPSISPGKNVGQFMQDWVSWVQSPQQIQINQNGFFRINFQIPGETPKGTYLFTVTACYNRLLQQTLNYADCNPSAPPTNQQAQLWGGSSQQVLLEVV